LQNQGGGQTELNAERIRLFFRKSDDGWKLSRTESTGTEVRLKTGLKISRLSCCGHK